VSGIVAGTRGSHAVGPMGDAPFLQGRSILARDPITTHWLAERREPPSRLSIPR
jgi:hypothetical protein